MATLVSYRDMVPKSLRQQWREAGYYPDRDIFTLFAYSAARNPEREAVVDRTDSISYAHLLRVVEHVASTLQSFGIGPGDVVAVQLPNSWRSVAVELAVSATGAILLSYPIGRGWRGALSMLGRSHAAALVMPSHYRDAPHAQAFQALRRDLPDLHHVFTLGESVTGCVSLDPYLTPIDNSVKFRAPAVDPDGPARLLVSSGSEAEPKMVLYSHNALVGGRGAFIEGLRGSQQTMRSLFLVPLGSSYGSNGTFVTVAFHGDTLLLIDPLDPELAIEMIERGRATHVFAVPTMLELMLASPRARGANFSSLEAVMAGGSSVSAATVRACAERFGCTVVNVYGSADGVNSHTDLGDDGDLVTKTVGRPRPEVTSIRICDEQGRDMADGTEGEIVSRGPMAPMCYFGEPELDARHRTADGWVRTGDLGLLRPDGRLAVVGRKKEIIVRGGYNVSPAEIEQLIGCHPSVQHAICVGTPDRIYGEKVCLCIVYRPGAPRLDLDAVRDFLVGEKGLEHRKLPDLVREIDELPINAAGKVDKRLAKRELAKATAPAERERAPDQAEAQQSVP